MDAKPIERKISVVVPTYNSEKYIQRAIDSLYAQEDPPDEIIFSDDGSTDSTIQVIQNNICKLQKNNINVVLLKNNHSGPGAARNSGIIKSNNGWIAFLDSDDFWKPEKILIVRQKIDETKNLLIIHWEEFIQTDGTRKILKHGDVYEDTIPIPIQLYKNNFLSTSAVVVNKEVLIKVGGFDQFLPNGQDYDLWLKISPYINIKVIKKILGCYIEEYGSITSKPYYYRLKSYLHIAWLHRDKASFPLFILKLFKLLFSRQWLAIFKAK